jgi:hypothetical protein
MTLILEELIGPQLGTSSVHFMESRGSLPHSQEPVRRQSNNVRQLFCDRFLKRHLLTVSRSFMNVTNRVLWRMAIILKPNKVNLFVSFVLFVFWYHSPNVLDTPHICNISWLRVNKQHSCVAGISIFLYCILSPPQHKTWYVRMTVEYKMETTFIILALPYH